MAAEVEQVVLARVTAASAEPSSRLAHVESGQLACHAHVVGQRVLLDEVPRDCLRIRLGIGEVKRGLEIRSLIIGDVVIIFEMGGSPLTPTASVLISGTRAPYRARASPNTCILELT